MANIGIYGNSLDAFPELFRQIHAWAAAPKVGGGYDIGTEIFVPGIILDTNSNSIFRRRVGAGHALDSENQDILWVDADVPIEVGMFLHHPEDGTVHRVVQSLDKSTPGGFKRFVIERAGGANGTNETEVPISEGTYL